MDLSESLLTEENLTVLFGGLLGFDPLEMVTSAKTGSALRLDAFTVSMLAAVMLVATDLNPSTVMLSLTFETLSFSNADAEERVLVGGMLLFCFLLLLACAMLSSSSSLC